MAGQLWGRQHHPMCLGVSLLPPSTRNSPALAILVSLGSNRERGWAWWVLVSGVRGGCWSARCGVGASQQAVQDGYWIAGCSGWVLGRG